ncbi:site-specific integrase [Rhodocyclus tenuis]|uniref:Integrase n=1 Tax=Rhodocyclus tenuis TaxID=1066 RepID=A0A840G995_RHOTE|nr:site-specific integrase [Rhodocyclus tenuis]MBB4248031.1 integrase [Rhodocyclus tenuis]
MPAYLTHKDNTYYFRQGVPPELRPFLGRREIKKSLGHDYVRAVRECKRYAVDADNLLAEARAKLDNVPVDPFSRKGIKRTEFVTLTQVTPEIETQFGNLTRAALLETDRSTRIAGMDRAEFEEYGQHIDAGLVALRRQLAMDDVEPMIASTRMMLFGRGYQPEFSPEDWRRLAYVMTESTLQAYEGMAARQRGTVVDAASEAVLPSQFEVQNAPKAAAAAEAPMTWQGLYDVWVKECDRRENTTNAYLAAMKLFADFCPAAPNAVTREDVLEYRDFLMQEKSLAASTVANKIGFVGTLISAGSNSAEYAKYLPHNPFANIKIKQAKRGKADQKRQPFSDEELVTIFGAPIYTVGFRPLGGGGEAAAWIPAIAYLTGMRLEEIALLKTSQFHTDAKGNHYIHTDAKGNHYIHTEDGKNENSADRDVPLHPDLIAAGLLDYVKTCSGRLFPKVKCDNEVQSKAYSQWYGRYLSKLGITAKSKVFHSFRHLFKDLCRNARMDDSAIDQICGHEPGTVGGRYGKGRRIDVPAGLMAKIVPPERLPAIVPAGRFAKIGADATPKRVRPAPAR